MNTPKWHSCGQQTPRMINQTVDRPVIAAPQFPAILVESVYQPYGESVFANPATCSPSKDLDYPADGPLHNKHGAIKQMPKDNKNL